MDAITNVINWIIKVPLLCCGWIIFGTMTGALARRATKAEDQPFWSDLMLGIAGGIIGGFIAGVILNVDIDDSVVSISYWVVTAIIAFLGSMLLIFLGRLLRRESLVGDERERRRKKRGGDDRLKRR